MKTRLEKFKNKEYRDGYVETHIRRGVARQIKVIREQREISKQNLAQKIEKAESTVKKYEDPYYGKYTIKNLCKIASALDVGLIIKFVPYSEYFKELDHQSPDEISALSFEEEFGKE